MKNNDLNKHPSPDLCVFIGRFQPLHAGHCRVINAGLSHGKFMVVLVGSANGPRTVHNPFTTDERIKMVKDTFQNDPRLLVLPLEDSDYNLTDWLERTHQCVDLAWQQIKSSFPEAPAVPSVSLIGHAKDATSYYLKLFPRWGSIDVPQEHVMCATTLRRELFGDYDMFKDQLLDHEGVKWPLEEQIDAYAKLALARADAFFADQAARLADNLAESDISSEVLSILQGFVESADYRAVCGEYLAVAKNKFIWRLAPYAPICQAADAVVVQSGHVLLLKRNSYPGKGLWALPGGYVEEYEEFLDAALRELNEEVGLKVPDKVLLGHLKDNKRFSAPRRSARGRMVTEAFLIHLDPGPLPKTKKAGLPDDEEAQAIAWVPISALRREDMFEDHYAIIKNMTAQI